MFIPAYLREKVNLLGIISRGLFTPMLRPLETMIGIKREIFRTSTHEKKVPYILAVYITHYNLNEPRLRMLTDKSTKN